MAAFLLIFPGIVTSIFGFFVYRQNNTSDEEIIDVEIIEERK